MRALAAALTVLALAGCGGGDDVAETVSAGPSEDAAAFLAHLESTHPDPFHAASRAQLEEAARGEGLVALMRLAALPGERDGHTGIFPLDPGHERPPYLFPLRLYAFPEGLFVVGEVGRVGVVGARLVAVGDTPVDRVAEAVEPLVPADNDWSRKARLAQWLVVAEVLRGLGITASAQSASFTLELPGGGRRTVRLDAVPAADWTAAFSDLWHPLVPMGLPRRGRPAYLARRDEGVWTALAGRGRAAYVAYNVTLDDPTPAARRLAELAGRPGVDRVVLDLRHNPGGNLHTYEPLLATLRRLGRTKRVVVLTSRTTFSAAVDLLADLERTTRVRIVGEPSGGSPNQYGDPSPVDLPRSGLRAQVATVLWEKAGRGDDRLAFEPDVRVDLTAADFFAGRDPILEAALR